MTYFGPRIGIFTVEKMSRIGIFTEKVTCPRDNHGSLRRFWQGKPQDFPDFHVFP